MPARLPVRIHPAALWRDPELHPDRLIPRSDPTANRNRSHRYRPIDANHVQWDHDPWVPDPQQHDDGGTAFRRFDRYGRLDQHSDGTGYQWPSGANESPGAWGSLSFAGLSAQLD